MTWLGVLLFAGFLAVSLGGYYVSKDSVREGKGGRNRVVTDAES